MHTGSTLPLAPFHLKLLLFLFLKKEFPLVFPDTAHKWNSGVIVPKFPGPAQGQKLAVKLSSEDFKSWAALGCTEQGSLSNPEAWMKEPAEGGRRLLETDKSFPGIRQIPRRCRDRESGVFQSS